MAGSRNETGFDIHIKEMRIVDFDTIGYYNQSGRWNRYNYKLPALITFEGSVYWYVNGFTKHGFNRRSMEFVHNK